MKLINSSKNISFADKVEVAENFWSRLIGLLGRNSLNNGTALWIARCPSIHTFFMKFPIDVVFVDTSLKVCACYKNVRPWRLILPVHGASSVFECSIGAISRGQVEKGDQLHVVN